MARVEVLTEVWWEFEGTRIRGGYGEEEGGVGQVAEEGDTTVEGGAGKSFGGAAGKVESSAGAAERLDEAEGEAGEVEAGDIVYQK